MIIVNDSSTQRTPEKIEASYFGGKEQQKIGNTTNYYIG